MSASGGFWSVWQRMNGGTVSSVAGEALNVGIFEAASTTPQNLVLAASALAAVPTLVFFLFFQRNILSGLTAGSLKG